MKLIESYLKNNPCYKNNVNKTDTRYTTFQQRGPLGLMIHSVGTPQPKASGFISTWNKSTYTRACVHAFIDALTGEVYQTLPWNYRGWHGGGVSNNNYIGVEMCEPSTIKYTSGANFVDNNPTKSKECVLRTYNSAVELFAMLCTKYNLDPLKDGVVISHSEGYKRGIASNHADVEHLWSKYGLTMNQFRKDIKAKMTGSTVSESTTTPTTNSTSTESYRVKVTADALNVRSGPGTSYRIMSVIKDKGVYTIVETSNGWGKLKSQIGWIKLSYTKKV